MVLASSKILVILVVFSAGQGLSYRPESAYYEEEVDNRYDRSMRDLPQGIDSVVSQWRQKNGRKTLEGIEYKDIHIYYQLK